MEQVEVKESYHKKYYMANREKLLARSKQRYHSKKDNKEESKETKEKSEDDLLSKSNQSEAEVFEIEDVEVPNKTTIEKIKELFNVVKTE